MAVAVSIAGAAPPLVGVASIVAALFIAASRVYLRVHFVSDVVVGVGLGAGVAAIAGVVIGR